MKVVVAPNAFKDSLTTEQACRAISAGVKRAVPGAHTVHVPIADGGDGLIDALKRALGGELVGKTVTGPLFSPVEAEFLYLPDSKTAVVEMARASGLALLADKDRDARTTTTQGTGELALAALEMGAKRILIGIGGSATNDGGIGFASALGVKFLDDSGREIRPVGEDLPKIARIEMPCKQFGNNVIAWEAVCDVDNPLTGERGAAAVFGPQKGATPEDVKYLDAGLGNLARRIEECLGMDVEAMPGAGAAGGLGGGLVAFVGAALRPGVDVVLDMVGIDDELRDADLAITAEGRIDFQTAFGKGPAGVGARAKKFGVPCLAVAGGVVGDIANLHEVGIDACFSICSSPMTLDDAMKNGSDLLTRCAEQVVRAFVAGKTRGGA